MAGTISIGGVGAGLSQAQLQTYYSVRSLKDQTSASKALGAVALELVRTAMDNLNQASTQQHDLDVKA